MRNPCPKLLVYIGMADAVAMATEYISSRQHEVRRAALAMTRYVQHPAHLHEVGRYSDDTEMSVANAHVLLAHDGPYQPLDFAEAYVREFWRGGCRKGYSRSFQAFLEQTGSGEEFLDEMRPHSEKNGAAMRSAVIGVLPTVHQVLEVATQQARLTHDTHVGTFGARAVALMAHYALHENEPMSKAGSYCLDLLPPEDVRQFGHVLDTAWTGKPVKGGQVPVGITTVHACAHLVMREPSLMAMLTRAIRWGGDTDSVAAIAWGIAAPRFQSETLPEFMERDLERGHPKSGVGYLIDVGARLMAKYETA